MAHLVDKQFVQRANTALMLAILWGALAACVIGATQRWTGDGPVASTDVQKLAIRVSQVRLVHTAPFERPVVPPVARMLQGRCGSSGMSGQKDGAAKLNSARDGPTPPSRSRHMHCSNCGAPARIC